MNKDYRVLPTLRDEKTEEAREFSSRFKDVWKRAKMKIKFRFIILRMIKASLLVNQNEDPKVKRMTTYIGGEELENGDCSGCYRRFVIMPNNKYLKYWNIIIVVSLAYCGLIMPVLIAFYYDDDIFSLDLIDRLLTGVFCVDFLINCNTAITHKSGKVIDNRLKILFNYAKGWMIIDFVAFFPFDLFSYKKNLSPIFKLFRLTRLYKLLKISKLGKWIKFKYNYNLMIRLQDLLGVNQTALQLIFTLTYIVLCVHMVTCIWILSARIENFSPSTWVYRSGLIDKGPADIYISSFYWAVTTISTVGYGDITANTFLEYFISMFWMLCGLYFLGFIIGTLSSFINSIDTYEKILMNKLVQVDEFCNESELDGVIKRKIKKAILNYSSVSKVSDPQKQEIINELSKDLKYEIVKSMHKGIAKEIPFFSNSNTELSIEIIPYLNPITVTAETFVYKRNEFSSEIYFILKGSAGYLNPNKEQKLSKNKYKSIFYTIITKDYFGDIEVLLKVPRKYSVYCRQHCEMLYISYEIINKLKFSHPFIYAELKGIAEEREKAVSAVLKNLLNLSGEVKNKRHREVEKFKSIQKLRNDMTNAVSSNKSNKLNKIDPNVIKAKISDMQAQLESLKNSLN